MEKYQSNVQNRKGDAVAGASVRVVTYPGGVLATIYSDDGVTPAANPLTTDSNGAFFFYAADGQYSLQITGNGIAPLTITNIPVGPSPITIVSDLSNNTDPAKGSALVGHYNGTTVKAALDARLASADLASAGDVSKGDALIGVTQPFTGATARTQHGKNSDFATVNDFGAVGDDATVNTSALSSAAAYGKTFVPKGVFRTGSASNAITNSLDGYGQIRDIGGNKRGRFFNAVTSAPSATGNENSIETAFNGDWSRNAFSVEHRITGADTVGQPVAGYTYTPEAFPNYTFLYNESGWNQSTSGNGGRTGIAAYRSRVYQAGQGDLVCFNGSAFVTGTRAGSTHFLANPAAVLFNGDMTAGQAGVYLNPGEFILHDSGFDVAGIGWVLNLDRTNSTGAKNAWWAGVRVQSVGASNVDVAYSASGNFRYGFDASQTTLSTLGAFAMKADQRIYGNVSVGDPDNRFPTANGTSYITFGSGLNGWNLVAGGNSSIQATPTTVNIVQALNLSSNGGVRITTSATGGAATALPAQPVGYFTIQVDGTDRKIPFYAL